MLPLCLSLALLSGSEDLFEVQTRVKTGGGEEIAGAQSSLPKPSPVGEAVLETLGFSGRALATSIRLRETRWS